MRLSEDRFFLLVGLLFQDMYFCIVDGLVFERMAKVNAMST